MSAADHLHTTVNFRDDMPGMLCAKMRPISGKMSTNFVVDLNARTLKTPKRLLTAIAHETTHIWQHATSALKPLKAVTYWRTMFLKEDEFSYMDLPWEVEAYRMEGQLYSAYVDHLKHRSSSCCSISRTAEVVQGSKWYTVVMMCGGQVKMAIPAKDMATAETLIEQWQSNGIVAFIG